MALLTELEKIVISWAAYQDTPPAWVELYKLTHPKRKTENPAPASVTHWKNAEKVQSLYKDQKRIFAARMDEARQAEREKVLQEIETETGERVEISTEGGKFDFSDRRQLLQYLNKVANTTKDEKRRFEALKMLADLQQFKKDESGPGEIQRFYMPLLCQDCPLYQKQREKLAAGV